MTYTLVFSPWRSEAVDLLSSYRKCIEVNHTVADFELVNALVDPLKAADRVSSGPPPYVLRDGKVFIKACTPALIQKVYNDCR